MGRRGYESRAKNKIMKKLIFLMGLFYLIQTYSSNPGLFDLPLSLYLKEKLNLDAAEFESFWAVIALPWYGKPLWGAIADSFPLFGYRIKGYFIACYTVAFALLLGLSLVKDYTFGILLIAILVLSTCIAFSDVLADKLMIAEGKPRGKTSILQAAQWTAQGLGGALMFYASGWIAQNASLPLAFSLTALVVLLGLISTSWMLNETQCKTGTLPLSTSFRTLLRAAKSWSFLSVVIFIVCFRLRLEAPLLYYQRDILNFDAQFLGTLSALTSVSIGLGAIFFGTVLSKFSPRKLFGLIIVTKIVSTLAFLFMQDATTAIVVRIFSGFTAIISSLGALVIAAQVCPIGAEGMAFALLMSLWNFMARPGIILGGWLWDKGMDFSHLILLSALMTSFCWFLIPLLRLEQEEAEL